uniref:Urea transporter n=1 Tax=Vannella robusta TaxID=1487602 RepID=A0A7S4M824_9EUKA|mmetsp:Transcript_1434/g.1835  ORF Transcript_1434/g.1835 Transcript_1434/m.1835 type:complete len:117 (+) Transcript_1434:815-1165(+)
MCFCSRISAVMCALGSAIGLFFAFGLGADRSDIYFGLWGFNPALSAICIGGMFFKFSSLSFLYAVCCCIGTCLIQGALFGMFAPWGVPIFTFPFNFGVLLFLIGHTSIVSCYNLLQ